jgi:hypothetical protein
MAADTLRTLQTTVGLIPNLAATMAESPAFLNGFLALRELSAKTGFSAGVVQVLSLTAAYEDDCAWRVAFHTATALKEGVFLPPHVWTRQSVFDCVAGHQTDRQHRVRRVGRHFRAASQAELTLRPTSRSCFVVKA